MKARLIAFAVLTAVAPAWASDPHNHWLEVKSAHFDVVTDAGDAQARQVARQLERMRSIFGSILPSSNAVNMEDAPITVLAFKDRKGFQAVEPRENLGVGKLEHIGYFLRGQDKNYILLRLDAEDEHPFAPLYHEYTHYLFRKDVWLPLWLDEGLAEFYQNTEIRDGEVELGKTSLDNLHTLRRNRMLPLETLFNVGYTSPYYHEEEKGSVFYAESWALTHLLMSRDAANNSNHLQAYLTLLSSGEDSATAARAVFGDLNQLQKALETYVAVGDVETIKVKATVAIDDALLTTRPVDRSVVDTVRAGVDVNTGRKDDAQLLLDTAVRENPKNVLALETMGYLKFRQGMVDEANKWFGQAVQVGSTSYFAQYYFAATLLQAHKSDSDFDDDAIETGLLKAIDLNPNFAPSYNALSSFYALRHEKLEHARSLSAQAMQLEPEDLDFHLNASQVLLELEQPAAALATLESARKLAKTSQQAAMIDSRITRCQVFATSLARKQNAEAQVNANAMTHSIVIMNRARRGDPPEPKPPSYPNEEPTGKHHHITGTISNVHCFYPTFITLDVQYDGRTTSLYRNNYFRIDFTTADDTPISEIKPCTALEGAEAGIDYAEISDKTVAGQIVAIEVRSKPR